MELSVAMATYNGEKYLSKQLDSIISQTLKPAEIIVCDDNSTDSTANILTHYQQNQKLNYEVNPARLGLIRNFKKAVSLAKGDYIALSDQDDEWMPEKLAQTVSLLKEIEKTELPCLVYSDLLYVDEQGNILNHSFRSEYGQDKYQHNLQTLLFSNFVTGCTIVMNKKMALYFAAMPDDVRFHDEWIALVAFTFGRAASVDKPLVRYRRHANNLSIANDTKPRNRFMSVVNQLKAALNGKDDFLETQFGIIKRFYQQYAKDMSIEKKALFDDFLRLENRSYITKKLAFRKVVTKFKVN